MSQFHFSDEEKKPTDSAASQTPKSGEPPLDGSEELPAKQNPFKLDDDEPQKPVAKPAPTAAKPPLPSQQTPAQPAKGPRPLQARPNAAMPPKTPAKPAGVSAIEVEAPPPPLETTAAALVNEGPVDGFSATLSGFGQSVRKALDVLEQPATWILRITFPIAVLCLAYILAAIFLGGASKPASAKQFAELVKNLAMASTVLKGCLIAAGISCLILAYDDNRLGAIVAAVGVVLHFVLPIGIKAMANNLAGMVITQHMREAGFALLLVGLIKATCDLAVFFYNLPNTIKAKQASIGAARTIEAKQQRIARDANMFSPCWNLPFCREAIRKMCPAFLAKKTCWKFGRGCYCDEEMISRIVRGESIESIKAPTRVSQSKKPPCGRCYIYLEHQSYKFRMLSPLALPSAVALTFVLWPAYTKVFGSFNKVLDSLWNSLSFSAPKVNPLEASDSALAETALSAASAATAAYWAQNLIGVLLGFMLVIYISKFIEYIVYKAKL